MPSVTIDDTLLACRWLKKGLIAFLCFRFETDLKPQAHFEQPSKSVGNAMWFFPIDNH
jgi:hypothetical protein